jgi:hypothetical protein
VVEKEGNRYRLIGFDTYSPAQIETLREACDEKLSEYISNRGNLIWSHRRKSAGYISGTLKYEVLKAAKFRCELCGISADEFALEVDHIIPATKGEDGNLQALCFSQFDERDRMTPIFGPLGCIF